MTIQTRQLSQPLLQGDAAGRLQLELGWLSVVESVDEINTVAIVWLLPD